LDEGDAINWRWNTGGLNHHNLLSAVARSALLVLLALALTADLCSPEAPSVEEVPKRSSEQDVIKTEVFVRLSESCVLFDPEVEHLLSCKISATFSKPVVNSSQLTIYLPTSSVTIVAVATYQDGTQARIQPTMIPMGYGADVVPIFYFDGGLVGFDITILGNLKGLSLLWRNLVDLRLILPSFSQVVPYSYRLQIEAPNAIEVTSITSPEVQAIKAEETPGESSKTYTLSLPASFTVYYRPNYWLALGLVIFFAVVCAVLLLPYLFKKIRLSSVPSITKVIAEIGHNVRRRLSAERFLTFYILCSLLMVSLSLVAGPDPRIKIYAVAPPYLASTLERELASRAGPVQVIGPQDTVSEFETIANLGIVKAVVVSYYPKVALGRITKFVLGAMEQVPLILVDEYMADPDLVRELEAKFADKVIIVQGLGETSFTVISRELQDLRVRNALGIESRTETFKAIAAMVAALSLLVAFFGLAFLSSRLIETGRNKGLGAIPEAIMLSAFVFYFTQAVYMASSVLLAMPIGLHAVTSGSKELTAVGLLGFGGGSSPRAISGVLGFLLGAFVAIKGRSELDRFGIIAFAILVAFLVVDPFTGGELFYDAVLFFLSGPRSEVIRTSIVYTKDILSNMGRLFGGWVTGIYGLSTGEILFYAGALPIFLFPYLKRSTATALLLMSGLAAGSGFIRTAEMTPYKTVASLIPGLTTGLAVVVMLLVASLIEERIRMRLRP
jgi:hypothetical protein